MGAWVDQLDSMMVLWDIWFYPVLVCLVLLRWACRPARPLWMKIAAAVLAVPGLAHPALIVIFQGNTPPRFQLLQKVAALVWIGLSFLMVIVLPICLVGWAFRAKRSQAVKLGAICVLTFFTIRFVKLAWWVVFGLTYPLVIGPTIFLIGWAIGVLIQAMRRMLVAPQLPAYRPLAIVSSVVVLALFGLWTVLRVTNLIQSRPHARPGAPYVREGQVLIHKKLFFEAPKTMGYVGSLSSRSCDPGYPDAMTVVSSRGFALETLPV